MKLFIVFVILLFTFPIISTAQKYNPFPDSLGFWRVEYHDIDCLMGGSAFCEDYQYLLKGDTVISSKSYKKIYMNGMHRYQIASNVYGWSHWDGSYIGGLFDDTLNKRVYYVPKNSINDTLLYDFNLNVGDTLPQSYSYDISYGVQDTIIIDTIDSIQIGNIFAKRFHLDRAGFGKEYLIEGIGSTLGLLERITSFFEHSYSLECFRNGNLAGFVKYDTTTCDLIVGRSELTRENDTRISINPNPITGTSLLNIEGNLTENYSVVIFNSFGQKIIELTNPNKQATIRSKDFTSGLYFLVLYSDGDTEAIKFVVN